MKQLYCSCKDAETRSFFAKADTDSHELTETTKTRDIDARDVIADADPNNHSSSNTFILLQIQRRQIISRNMLILISMLAVAVSARLRSSSPNLSSDPGFWSELSPSDIIDYWLAKGPASCRNRKANYERLKRLRDPNHPNENRYRFFQRSLFFGRKANGEKYFRNWLLYSPANGNVYCFCCKLFSTALQKSRFSTDGFSDWNNATKSIMQTTLVGQ